MHSTAHSTWKHRLHEPDCSSGFDISGHVFVLLFSNWVMMEECHILHCWINQVLSNYLADTPPKDTKELHQHHLPHHHQVTSPKSIHPSPPCTSTPTPGATFNRLTVMFVKLALAHVAFIGPFGLAKATKIKFDKSKWCLLQSKPFLWATLPVYLMVQCTSLIWDLMLLQTIFFYHTTLEKIVSFFWTILCCQLYRTMLTPHHCYRCYSITGADCKLTSRRLHPAHSHQRPISKKESHGENNLIDWLARRDGGSHQCCYSL